VAFLHQRVIHAASSWSLGARSLEKSGDHGEKGRCQRDCRIVACAVLGGWGAAAKRSRHRANPGAMSQDNPRESTTMRIATLFSIVVAAAGCNQGSASTAPADNTKVNERDQKTAALTPGDQGENEVDRTITQKVRQGVMKNDSLSVTAKNVKIITANAVVTLRGPVKSDKEKTDIVTIAQGTDGVKRVDNQLEVAAN
jgi:hypothetical protein